MIGRVLGPYRIEKEIGKGGMGTVFLAVVEGEAPGLTRGKRVALKVIHSHLLEAPGFFKRFLLEAEIGRRVRHPNVVRTFDVDALEVDGETHHFLVTEYVEGQTLRELIRDLGRVPEDLARHIGREVTKALVAIHAEGVVHRDVKPENVLITRDDTVKVMDLGVALLKDEAIRLSQTGQFLGSVRYASPEQFSGGCGDIDGRADLYSVGLLIQELTTGDAPFGKRTAGEVMRLRAFSKDASAVGPNPYVSSFLQALVEKLLSPNRDARFDDAGILLTTLTEGERSRWWRSLAEAGPPVPRTPRIPVPRETALCGREEPIAMLRSRFDAADGGDGRVVLIEGEAGIGKTRLVDEFARRLEEEGREFLLLYGSYPPGGAATAAGAFSAAFLEHLGRERLPSSLRSLLSSTPGLVAGFAAFLEGEPPPEGEPIPQDSLQTAFVHLTRALAASRTIVLVIDDLHFAPEGGRTLFAALTPAVPGHRILLIGTHRPGMDRGWIAGLARLPHVTRQFIERLEPEDLTRLLSHAFGSDKLAGELADTMAKKSDGNPYFLLEMIRELRKGGALVEIRSGSWDRTRRISELGIPSTVTDLIQARIADLTEEEREFLEVASCCGFEFDPLLVAGALGRDAMPALKVARRIEKDRGLIRAAGRAYTFDFHQLRDAIHDGIFEVVREEYHTALGTALEARHAGAVEGIAAARICRHLLLGNAAGRSLPYLMEALAHLRRSYLNDDAVEIADRALAIAGLLDPRTRVEVLLEKASRLDLTGRADEERDALDTARSVAADLGDPVLEGRVERALGNSHLKASRHADALAHFESALARAEKGKDRALEGQALEGIGAVHQSAGRLEEAERALSRRVELAKALGDSAAEGRARGKLGAVAMFLGRYAKAEAQFRDWLESSRARGSRREEGIATGNLGALCGQSGRLGDARKYVGRRLLIAREIGDRRGQASATGNLGNIELLEGRPAQARALYEEWRVMARELGDRQEEANALVNLGLVSLELGMAGEAGESFAEGLALAREIGAPRPSGYALQGLGRSAEAEGDVEAAGRWYGEALAAQRGIPFPQGIAETLLSIARLSIAADRREEAATILAEASDLARDLDLAGLVVTAACYRALLSGAADEAAAELEARRDDLAPGELMEAEFILWRVTGERGFLESAFHAIQARGARIPAEHRQSMVEGVPLHREIARAWEDEIGGADTVV